LEKKKGKVVNSRQRLGVAESSNLLVEKPKNKPKLI